MMIKLQYNVLDKSYVVTLMMLSDDKKQYKSDYEESVVP